MILSDAEAAGRRRDLRLAAFDLAPWLAAAAVALALGAVTLVAATSSSRAGPIVLAAALAPFVAMVVGSVRRLLLAIVVLDVPFAWDINVGWRDDVAALGALGGLNLSLTTVALAGLYVLWLAELLARTPGAPRPRLRTSLPGLAYVGLMAVSAFTARDPVLASYEVVVLVQTFLLYLYVASTVRTRADLRFLVTVLVAALALEAFVVVIVGATGAEVSVAGISTYSTAGDGAVAGIRSGGTIGAPNATAAFLALFLGLAVGVLAGSFGRARQRLALITLVVGSVALVLTFSRGGWIAFAVSMVLASVVAWRRGWLSPRVPAAFALVLVVLALPFGGMIAARLSGSDDGSAKGRLALVRLAFRIAEDNPVFGVGPNNFAVAIPDYAGPTFAGDWLYTVHDQYMLVWAEAGTGAFLAFLWFLATTIRRGVLCARRDDPLLAPLAIALTAAVVGQMAHMVVEIFHSRAQVQSLWLVAALLAAIEAMAARAPTSARVPAFATAVTVRAALGRARV